MSSNLGSYQKLTIMAYKFGKSKFLIESIILASGLIGFAVGRHIKKDRITKPSNIITLNMYNSALTDKIDVSDY